MKKIQALFIALVAFLLVGTAQTADAQRRNNGRRHTTTPSRTPQRTTTPTERFVKEVAFYNAKVSDFCVDSKYIYYVEKKPNNAVMKIDRQTGEVSTLISGIANVYEGHRDIINKISIAGGKFIFQYADYPYKLGILMEGKYHGSDKWEKVYKTNGDYALIECHDSSIELYDVKNMTSILVNITRNGTGMEIGSDGSVWYPVREWVNGKDLFGVIRLDKAGKTTFFDLTRQSYVVSEGTEDNGWHKVSISYFTSRGDYLYVSCKRRIYRINMLQPTVWEEYAKVPPTIDSKFHEFWPNWKGDILNNDDGFTRRYYFYRVGAFDNPQCLSEGKYIKSGLTKFGWTEIWPSLYKIRVDIDNNYIMSGGGCLTIYNPDGVIGYEKARSKVIDVLQ